jgi:hypothetical protein
VLFKATGLDIIGADIETTINGAVSIVENSINLDAI